MKDKLKNKMSSCRYIILFFGIMAGFKSTGQISITSLPFAPATTIFDTYNPNSAGNLSATIPTGWTASSSITPTYRGQGNGTSNAGGYWGYGSAGEFSIGALRSGTSGDITYTVSFINNSGMTISSITLSWNYEQWRYANTSGWDCTGTGALIANATLNGKDFVGSSTGTSGTVTVTPVPSFTLSGLSIANGAAFGISWTTTDVGNADNGVSIDNFSISACCGALPVRWVSFEANSLAEQMCQIEWATTDEINNSYFEIQRSNDGGLHFNTIGKVNAVSEGQPVNKYAFMDSNAHGGKNFYRLKQVDLDGNFDYSPIRTVMFHSGHFSVKAWPNPSSSNISLRISHADENGKIFIVNSTGQNIFQTAFEEDTSDETIEVKDLQPGMYTLVVKTDDYLNVQKIVIIE